MYTSQESPSKIEENLPLKAVDFFVLYLPVRELRMWVSGSSSSW